jgi:hypothetical protein
MVEEVTLVRRVLEVSKVLMAQLVPLDILVQLVNKAKMVILEYKVKLEQRESKDYRVKKVQQD